MSTRLKTGGILLDRDFGLSDMERLSNILEEIQEEILRQQIVPSDFFENMKQYCANHRPP